LKKKSSFKLIYTNTDDKSMGYTIQKGKNKLTAEVVDLKNYTGKKRLKEG
jgi:hypothetical protein